MGTLWGELYTNGWTDLDAVLDLDSGEETMLWMGVQIVPCKGAILGQRTCLARRHSAVSCAKMAEPTEMPFRLWTRVGLRKHVLGGGHTGATWWIPLSRPCCGDAAFLSLTTCFCMHVWMPVPVYVSHFVIPFPKPASFILVRVECNRSSLIPLTAFQFSSFVTEVNFCQGSVQVNYLDYCLHPQLISVVD